MTNTNYVLYGDSTEVIEPGEEELFGEIASRMANMAKLTADRARNATRAVHAKSHGLLRAEFTVLDGLHEPLAQGLFAHAATYPAILRFSTLPGDILPDSISTPRGLAIKVIGVDGPMLEGHEGRHTQDLVLVNSKTFPSANTKAYLESIKQLEKHAGASEGAKQLVSTAAHAVESVIEAVGGSSPLRGVGHPHTNLLGETYCSLAALRYGKYIAKICVEPASENLKTLLGKKVDVGANHSALRDAVVEFFKTEEAVWEVKAQLCVDLEKMPVEDPSVEWPAELNPYQTVGRLVAKPQEAYSDARRVFVDELLSFTPWHGLAAHRPLGNIMRSRRRAYAASSAFRHTAAGRTLVEPLSIDELPD